MRLKRMYWIEIINFPRLCLMSSLPPYIWSLYSALTEHVLWAFFILILILILFYKMQT